MISLLPLDVMQKRAAYTIRQKQGRWYMNLVYFAIDMAAINGFVMYQLRSGTRQMRDQLGFRLQLVDCLLAASTTLMAVPRGPVSPEAAVTPHRPSAPKRKRQERDKELPPGRLVGQHLPVVTSERKRCVYCHYTGASRDGTVSTMCNTCGIHLCIMSGRNCFILYHTV